MSLLFVGRIPLLNPTFLNPNILPNSVVQFFVRRGFTPSANIFPQASKTPMSLLFVGRIPLLNPAFLNPNPLPNSKAPFFGRRGFTPSENISNNESSRMERRNTQRARCPDSLHLSLRGAKRRGNLTSMINRRSPAPVCRLTGWTKAQPYGGGLLPPQTPFHRPAGCQ